MLFFDISVTDSSSSFDSSDVDSSSSDVDSSSSGVFSSSSDSSDVFSSSSDISSPSGSDSSSSFVCQDNEFLCINDGFCITLTWICDVFVDCSDGSDEQGCGKTSAISSNRTIIWNKKQGSYFLHYKSNDKPLAAFTLYSIE